MDFFWACLVTGSTNLDLRIQSVMGQSIMSFFGLYLMIWPDPLLPTHIHLKNRLTPQTKLDPPVALGYHGPDGLGWVFFSYPALCYIQSCGKKEV